MGIITNYDAVRSGAKYYTKQQYKDQQAAKQQVERLTEDIEARRLVPKYSAISPEAKYVYQKGTRQEIPEAGIAGTYNKKTGAIKDIQLTDVDQAERVGFELAVRAIYIQAGRYLGPNHEVMKIIRNMKA